MADRGWTRRELVSTLAVAWVVASWGGTAGIVGCDTPKNQSGTKTREGGGGSASGAKRFVFLTNGDDPFWDTCNAGLREGVQEFTGDGSGYTAQMDKGNGKAEGQIDKLRQYATEPDIAGVAISVIQADNKAIADEMKKLQKAGKKVIAVDGDVNRERFRDARSYYIGTNNYVAGTVLGKATKAVLEQRGLASGGYAQFAGFTDNDNARSRMNGVRDALGGFTELDRKPDQMDRPRARDNVRTSLDNDADKIVALIGIWAYNAPAIADVVGERKVRDKVTVGVMDAASDAIKAMDDGNIDVMVVQNPFDMGRQTVRLLKAMCEDDQSTIDEMFPARDAEDGDVFTTGLRLVVPSEKSPVKAEEFDPRSVEFMLLPEFQSWLAKYKLKSS